MKFRDYVASLLSQEGNEDMDLDVWQKLPDEYGKFIDFVDNSTFIRISWKHKFNKYLDFFETEKEEHEPACSDDCVPEKVIVIG